MYLNTPKFHKYETREKILNVTIDYGLLSTSLKLLLLLSWVLFQGAIKSYFI